MRRSKNIGGLMTRAIAIRICKAKNTSARGHIKKIGNSLTISFPLILCSGMLSSLPRALRISCSPVGPEVGRPLGALSARRKHPSMRTISYTVGSERGPALASLELKEKSEQSVSDQTVNRCTRVKAV